MQQYFSGGLDVIISGVLALLYILFLPVIKASKDGKNKGLLSLLGAMVMYIPCLLIDFADWLKEQYELQQVQLDRSWAHHLLLQ